MAPKEICALALCVACSSCKYDHHPQRPFDPQQLAQDVGAGRYEHLVHHLGASTLEHLAQDVGQSTLVSLINAIDDVQRLVQLLTEPQALSVQQLVSLIQRTEQTVIDEASPSTDTVGKIASLINEVNEPGTLKVLFQAAQPRNGEAAMARLAHLIAWSDEVRGSLSTVVNATTSTEPGRQRLIRIINEGDDLRVLARLLNQSEDVHRLTRIINELSNQRNQSDGTGALLAVLNSALHPDRLARLLNAGSSDPLWSNDDTFDQFPLNQPWASSGPLHFARQAPTQCEAATSCIGVTSPSFSIPSMAAAALELTLGTSALGGARFDVQIPTHDTVLDFLIDDILAMRITGPTPWTTYVSAPILPGSHRFRWEVRSTASGTPLEVFLDNVVLPGDQGARFSAPRKIASLLNTLSIRAETTVSELLDGLEPAGIQRLAEILDRSTYSGVESETPAWVEIINALEAVPTLTGLLNGLTADGATRVAQLVNHVREPVILAALINGGAGLPGQRIRDVANNLDPVGTSALIRLLNEVPIASLLVLVNGAEQTRYIASLLNALELSGPRVENVGGGASTAALQLVGIVALLNENRGPSAKATVGYHLVRLLNDIAAADSEGATNVGRIISGLDPTAQPPGASRIVTLLDLLHVADDSERYSDPLCEGPRCFLDTYGRLTAFINALLAQGSDATTALVNGIAPDKLTNLSHLVANTRRIRYLSDVVNALENVDLMLAILNDPGLDVDRLRRVIDALGDHSYPGLEPPIPRYTSPFDTSTADGLGRLTALINAVVSPDGATNLTSVVREVNELDRLLGLLGGIRENGASQPAGAIHRIQYLSEVINHVENIELLLNILNGATGMPSVDLPALLRLLNEIGGATYQGSNPKPLGDMRIFTGVVNLLGWDAVAQRPRSLADQARVTQLINDVNGCGIEPGFELNQPWLHIRPEPCVSGNKRLTDLLLGLDDPYPISVIVGDVADTQKTIDVVNGYQAIEPLINLINVVPGEVLSALLNELEPRAQVVYGSALYLLNQLPYQSFAALLHHGTGIGEGANRDGSCNYFTGVGPVRLARLLNSEMGTRLRNLLQNFGWRTAVAAIGCGFGVEDNQTLENRNGGAIEVFPAVETLAINGPHFAAGSWNYGPYLHRYAVPTDSYNCVNYYPENLRVFCILPPWFDGNQIDNILWQGDQICIVRINRGIASVWDIINGDGVVAWLVEQLGQLPYPPNLGTTDKNWNKCQVRPELGEPAVQYKPGQRDPEFAYPPYH